MRDEELSFVELMHRDLRTVRWPEPIEIRARARRRSRRTAVAAAMAVLAVASAVAFSGRPAAPPAAPSVAAPLSAEIPTAVLLSEDDPSLAMLESKADIQLSNSGLGEPVRVDALLEACARSQGAAVPEAVSRYSRSRNLLHNRAAGQSATTPQPVLAQDVYRMAPGAVGTVFDDLDRFAALCATWQQTAPVQRGEKIVAGTRSILHRWQVVDRDFAGDRAVLLRHSVSEGTREYIVKPDQRIDVRLVVQVGDLVTVILPEVGGIIYPTGHVPDVTDEQLRTLARAAATRMCVAADPPC